MPKTAIIPAIRVESNFRQEMESVLQENETLSRFVEETIRATVAHRIAEREFTEKAMLARNEAKRTGKYVSHEELMAKLKSKLEKAKQARNTQT